MNRKLGAGRAERVAGPKRDIGPNKSCAVLHVVYPVRKHAWITLVRIESPFNCQIVEAGDLEQMPLPNRMAASSAKSK
jgi:hypothetical protein